MAITDLSNLKITRQEEPMKVETTEKVSTPSGSFSERMTATGNEITREQEGFTVDTPKQLPSFDLTKKSDGIDKEKVQRFIEHSINMGKSMQEIEQAYNKGVQQGAFNIKTSQPTQEEQIFQESIANVAEKNPGFLQRISSLGSSFFREEGEKERKELGEILQGTEKDPTLIGRATETFQKRGEMGADILTRGTTGEVGALESGVLFGANFLGTLSDLVGDVVVEGFTEVTPETAKDKLQEAIIKVAETKGGQKAVGLMQEAQESMETLQKLDPALAARYQGAFDFINAALDLMGGKAVKETGKQVAKQGTKQLAKTADEVVNAVTEASKKVDLKPIKETSQELVEKGKETISEGLQKQASKLEAAASQQNREIAEKIALPDVGEMTAKQREKIFDKTTPILDSKGKPTGKFEIVRDPREISVIEETKRLLDEGKIKEGTPTVVKKTVVDNEIADLSNKIDADLRTSKVSLSKDDMKTVIDDLSQSILDNPSIVGSNESAVKKAIAQFEKLLKKDEYFPEDILKLRKDFDRIIKDAKGDKVFDPNLENAFTISTREFRQGLNNKVADLAPESNLKEILRRQSALYDLNDTLKVRFGKETETFVKRLLNKVQNVSGIPKTEIVELLALLSVAGIGGTIAAPLAIGGATVALGREGIKILTRPGVKKFRASILRKLDDAIKNNPKSANNIKEVKKEIDNLTSNK